MESLGGGIRGFLIKTKHSVEKWRVYMKHKKFRCEAHFGKTEEVIFKSELEAQNKELKLVIAKQQDELELLKSGYLSNKIGIIEKSQYDLNLSINELQNIIKYKEKEIKQLKKDLRNIKGGN